jgi:hypothetical protein
VLSEERRHGNVLVQIGPVKAHPASDQPPVLPLLWRGSLKSRKPIEGRADFSPVLETDAKFPPIESDIRGG